MKRWRDGGGTLADVFVGFLDDRACTVGMLTLVVFLACAYDTVLLVPWFTARARKGEVAPSLVGGVTCMCSLTTYSHAHRISGAWRRTSEA